LVPVPRRHVVTVAELFDGEAAALGQWQVRLSRALYAETISPIGSYRDDFDGHDDSQR
jgi:hypothetical protein